MNRIKLETNENALYQIVKGFNHKSDFNEIQQILHASEQLTKMLLERQAIPKNRLNYFTKVDYQTGRTKKSRKEIFKMNNKKGKAISGHPNFIKYLEYFIEGTNLATFIKNKAFEIFEGNHYTDDAAEQLFSFLKSQKIIPNDNFERHKFAEEIFKLVIDLDCDLEDAKRIRSRVIKSR